MGASPQSVASELILSAEALRDSTRYFLDPSDMRWRRLVKQAEGLQGALRYQSDGIMGILKSNVRQFDEADRYFENSLRLQFDMVTVLNWIGAKIVSGQFSRAQELVRKYGSQPNGYTNRLLQLGAACGAFETVSGIRYQAELMNIEIDKSQLSSSATKDLLARAGLNENDIALHLEAASEVLLRRNIRSEVRIKTVGDDYCSMLTMVLVIPGSVDDVFDLNMELAQMEEERGIKKHVAFDVTFGLARKNTGDKVTT